MNWKELYLNRCKRIYPLYLFVVLIIVAITLLNTHVDFTNLDDFFTWLKKWLLFRGTHFQNFDSDIIIAGVHWTSLYEWSFYFSLPLIYMISHWRLVKPIFWCLMLILSYLLLRKSSFALINILFPMSFLAVIWSKKWKSLMFKHSRVINLYMWFVFPLCLFFIPSSHIGHLLLTVIAFSFIANGFDYLGILQHKGLKILGDISYSIYLLHGIVLYFLFKILHVYDFQHANIYIYSLYQPFVVLITVGCSLFTYRYIEQPFLRKTKK